MEYMKNKVNDYLRILCSTVGLQMRQSFSRPMFRFCLICNPIVNTIFLYELFLNKEMDLFINYVVLGAGLMGIWSCICFSSVGDIHRERYYGTLPIIYISPSGFGAIVFGKTIGNTILSLFTLGISYITAEIISDKSMIIKNNILFFLSILLVITCFVIVSMCAAYVLMLSRKTELYMNIIEIPLIFVCGFVFPVEILPKWIQYISNCIPMTWAIRLVKESANKIESSEYLFYLFVLLIELLILILLTIILYRWIDYNIRIKATLEVS